MTDHPSALVSVPREPTQEMRGAIAHADWHSKDDLTWEDGWRIMLAAAPAAPQAAGVAEWTAEQEVGRAVYERIEKLMDTDPRGIELDYLSHLVESVEEVGGYDGPVTPLRAQPPAREGEGE